MWVSPFSRRLITKTINHVIPHPDCYELFKTTKETLKINFCNKNVFLHIESRQLLQILVLTTASKTTNTTYSMLPMSKLYNIQHRTLYFMLPQTFYCICAGYFL